MSGLALAVSPQATPVWVRLDLVENTAEGPAFDRCQLEATFDKNQSKRWRVFYGDAHADAQSGWSANRSASGCHEVGSEPFAQEGTLRGSPYYSVDVELSSVKAADHEIVIDASLTYRRLSGFGESAPTYDTRTEKKTLRVQDGKSAVIPILSASEKEMDQFRVHELLLKFQAVSLGGKPAVEYGEVAVTADVPRAELYLDGGLVGRTSADGPVVLRAVRIGDREVTVRDASGREAKSVTRVAKGRQSKVSITVLKLSPASADGLRPAGRNPQGSDEFWREKDAALIVRIPGGEFQMGDNDDGYPSEHPRHTARVGGFLLDKTEVTWGQYKKFLDASHKTPGKVPLWGMPESMPVSSIPWGEASEYCAWVGARLPTEAEWEHAAKGDETRQYPWGNTFDAWRCNTRDGGPHAPSFAASYPDCVGQYGVLDQSGSVSEWCSDWFSDTYDDKAPADNPTGPATGRSRVSRGGDWMSAAQSVRTTTRVGVEAAWQGPMQGFRCAQSDRAADGK